MRGNKWRAVTTVGFVVAVLALGCFGLYQVAGRQWQVQPTFRVRVQFDTIAGLEVGNRVRLQGIDAGVIERVIAPDQPGQPVELVLRVNRRLKHLIRDRRGGPDRGRRHGRGQGRRALPRPSGCANFRRNGHDRVRASY